MVAMRMVWLMRRMMREGNRRGRSLRLQSLRWEGHSQRTVKRISHWQGTQQRSHC
jgi:hypothetical protein